jgi:hypothetical protein
MTIDVAKIGSVSSTNPIFFLFWMRTRLGGTRSRKSNSLRFEYTHITLFNHHKVLQDLVFVACKVLISTEDTKLLCGPHYHANSSFSTQAQL